MASQKDFVLEVIEKYKEFPCLWQVIDADYHNKIKRDNAIEEIVKLFKTKDNCANKDTDLKKHASLRACFKKKHNKVRTSMKSEAGSAEVHVPKLWYYDYMLFLADQDVPRRSQSISSIIDDMPFGEDDENTDPFDSATMVQQPSPSSQQSNDRSSVNESYKRTKAQADAVLTKISKRLDVEKTPVPKQKYSAFGEHIAEKLRLMPNYMAIFCQKIINDAIFFGELNNLNITSHIVTNDLRTLIQLAPQVEVPISHEEEGRNNEEETITDDPIYNAYARAVHE